MRPSRILILSLIVFLPDSSNQQNYRYDRYNYGQWKDVNYYDNYYKYTHNQPITGYYGFNYGNYGRGYNSRSLNGGYFRDYYDDYNPRRYQSYSPRSYYDEYYIRGQSYERPTGPYYDQQGYNYGQPPYDGYYRR
ncbi:hypothetical protein BIW11_12141 [Tropilaelaps mercedesae]|uniref:Uncharacterized protein n=1 Tax=Tropilaelaps mercedesae TaxID=418985 RepID=A0A1V9X7V0_9ACAR|nr:hypothetical protein BIW11_12141 [Tropilaelaps mercedesae]